MNIVTLEARMALKKCPENRPIMYQEWRDLLFLHWQYDPIVIQKTLPQGLFVDTFEGKAFLSVVPFFIQNLKFFNLPPVPGLSHFTEINLRTYIYDENGVPGVWFYSLDINSILATMAARTFFHLPYHKAQLESLKKQNRILITGKRAREQNLLFNFEYSSQGDILYAVPGTLEFFLIERYLFFCESFGQIKKGRIFHESYPLTPVTVVNWSTDLFERSQFQNPLTEPDCVHYSSGVNVDIYRLEGLSPSFHRPIKP